MSNIASAKEKFRKLATHPLKFSLFLLRYLPAAFFSGVRIRTLNNESCSASVPYKWFSRNPFGSTYFACLAMAAELSTGSLALLHLKGAGAPVSMLVLEMKATFHKKGIASTIFSCEQGALLEQAVKAAVLTKEPQTCTVESIGYNTAGDKIASFEITWTFKAKA